MPAISGKQVFSGYPPGAQVVIAQYSDLFQRLPAVLAASLLRELRNYDWLFPAERHELDAQLAFLARPHSVSTESIISKFAALPVPLGVSKDDWATQPGRFLEDFTAGLWARQAIEQFRECGDAYGAVLQEVRFNLPDRDADHLVIVLIGRGALHPNFPLFAKLRENGAFFSNVNTSSAVDEAIAALHQRSAALPDQYQHWIVDGAGSSLRQIDERVHAMSFEDLAPVRSSLQARMQEQMTQGVTGPETARTALMSMQPGQVAGFRASESEIMKHFTVRVLTDGSGTQVFSTTFVQWSSREILRRARPRTLLARYAPRVSKLPQNLFGAGEESAQDPEGALQDGDMGAYYSWLNLRSLYGEGKKAFIAVFENGNEAVAIAPAFAAGSTSKQCVTLKDILGWSQG